MTKSASISKLLDRDAEIARRRMAHLRLADGSAVEPVLPIEIVRERKRIADGLPALQPKE